MRMPTTTYEKLKITKTTLAYMRKKTLEEVLVLNSKIDHLLQCKSYKLTSTISYTWSGYQNHITTRTLEISLELLVQ